MNSPRSSRPATLAAISTEGSAGNTNTGPMTMIPPHDRNVAAPAADRHGQGASRSNKACQTAIASASRRARQCLARPKAAPCRAAPGRLSRGPRLSHPAGSRSRRDSGPRRRPLAAWTRSVLILGPTGIGKSWIACALGNQAARNGFSVRYQRLARLLDELALARVEGQAARLPTSGYASRARRPSDQVGKAPVRPTQAIGPLTRRR